MQKSISETISSKTNRCLKQTNEDISTQNSQRHPVNTFSAEKNLPTDTQKNKMEDEEDFSLNVNKLKQPSKEEDQKTTKQTFYKRSLQWLALRFKKFRIRMQTFYLAISYLIKYVGLADQFNYNHELISAVCLLLAAKMNQIYLPSIKSLLSSITFTASKQQIITVQQEMLRTFDFDVGFERNAYSIVNEFLNSQEEQKRKNAQKLLFLGLSRLQNLQFGQQVLGMSIIYLVKPQVLPTDINKQKIKKIAFSIYKLYKEKKQKQKLAQI